MSIHTINLDWAADMAFDVHVNGHTLRLDAEAASGGTDTGPRPKPLMLAALAGCTAMDVVSLLRKMRTAFDDLKIDVSGELTEEHPKIYKAVHIVYHLYGSAVEKDKVEKAIGLSQEKYCGVSAMMRSFAKVTWEVQYHS